MEEEFKCDTEGTIVNFYGIYLRFSKKLDTITNIKDIFISLYDQNIFVSDPKMYPISIDFPCNNKFVIKDYDEFFSILKNRKDIPCECGSKNHYYVKFESY